MKIRRIETFCTPHVGLVRVSGDDGAQGWGQVSTYHADISVTILHRQVAPWVLEKNLDDDTPQFTAQLGDLVENVFEREHKFPGSHLCRAVGGVETALWDLHGKQQGKSVCELLGGVPRPLRVYASSMKRDITPTAEAARFARLRDKHGYDAFKFRVGRECGRDADEWKGRTEEIVPAVRRALGDDVALLADANSCYSPARAIEVGKLLQQHGICHFEEPCPYWLPQQTQQVTAALDLDVTGGEQDNNIALWRYLLEGRVMDVAQPDVCYLGGISRTLQVAAMAQKAGIAVTPHAANLSLVTVFTLHLMGAISGGGPYVEFSIEEEDYYPWQYGVYNPMPVAKDGKVAIPDAPGWGVEIRDEWLRQAVYQESKQQ